MWSYYEGLCARVCTEEWTTNLIPIGVGVPQRCTAKFPFQLLLDYHSSLLPEQIGYQIANTTVTVSKPTYADDVGFVDKTAAGCQESVNAFAICLLWSRTLYLKVEKCRSLACRVFNPGESTISINELFFL